MWAFGGESASDGGREEIYYRWILRGWGKEVQFAFASELDVVWDEFLRLLIFLPLLSLFKPTHLSLSLLYTPRGILGQCYLKNSHKNESFCPSLHSSACMHSAGLEERIRPKLLHFSPPN